jgi:hypothetical protein
MQAMSKIVLTVFMAFVFQCAVSQNIPQLQKFREYVQHNTPPGYDSSARFIYLVHGNNINYLYPLYQLFKNESKFKASLKNDRYYEELSAYLSFTEDYQSALQYMIKAYDTVNAVTEKQITRAVEGLKDITHVDAAKYILFAAKNSRVVMINEAHNKPVHRAFVISLLGGLYKKGFHYLALEMLNNSSSRSLEKLMVSTGHYTAEPLAGELVRTALEIGFTLVPYEDTLAYRHNAGQRDSAQAQNIWNAIRQDTAAKMLVLAGYGHIAERMPGSDYMPMASAFKMISGVDPLTIDQTDMTEEGNFGYGKALYSAYMQKYSLAAPSIALINNQPVNITNNADYDLAVIHPPTTYRDGRPVWLGLGGLRKPVYVKPSVKNAFLVQAYYQSEWEEAKPSQHIPADQTYIPTNNLRYLLYLKKGKFIVLFRDMDYKIVGQINVEVS